VSFAQILEIVATLFSSAKNRAYCIRTISRIFNLKMKNKFYAYSSVNF